MTGIASLDPARTLSDNPALPLFPPPFPFGVPGNRGGIAFRPGHHHGITPAGRPPQPLSQVAKFAASVFVGALISTLARDRTSAVTGLRALVERRCTFQNALSCSDRFEVIIRPA